MRDAVEKGLAIASALAIGAPSRSIHEAHRHNAVLFKNRHSDIDKLPLIALVESQFWRRIRDKWHERVWLKIVTRLRGDRCIRNIRAPRLRIWQLKCRTTAVYIFRYFGAVAAQTQGEKLMRFVVLPSRWAPIVCYNSLALELHHRIRILEAFM